MSTNVSKIDDANETVSQIEPSAELISRLSPEQRQRLEKYSAEYKVNYLISME